MGGQKGAVDLGMCAIGTLGDQGGCLCEPQLFLVCSVGGPGGDGGDLVGTPGPGIVKFAYQLDGV